MMVIELPETLIDEIVEQVKQKLQLDLPPREQPDGAVLELRRKFALINAKERISISAISSSGPRKSTPNTQSPTAIWTG